MAKGRFDEGETGVKEFDSDSVCEASPTTKLERRRLIEDLFEEKRLREELGDFDLVY